MKVWLALATTALGASAAIGAPSSDRDAMQHRGQLVFDRWCAACHSPTAGNPGTMALQEKYHGALPAALANRTDLTPDKVGYYVRHGVSVMPQYRKTEITDAELADLSAWFQRNTRSPHPAKK